MGVGGFLLPGNRVDVLATKQEGGSGREAKSETILYDLRVLAVDQTASTDKTQPVVVRAVTLEMTPEETEKLVKAQSEGKLQLALRNPLEEKRPVETKPDPVPVVAVAPKPAPKPVVRRSSGGGGGQVTIIRGTEIEKVSVQR